MLDPQLFRSDLDFVQAQLKRRGLDFDTDFYTDLENRRKSVQVKTQALQNERNSRSKLIGQTKAKGEDVQPLLDQIQGLGEQLKTAETELADIQAEMQALMEVLPNFLDPTVPAGKD